MSADRVIGSQGDGGVTVGPDGGTGLCRVYLRTGEHGASLTRAETTDLILELVDLIFPSAARP